MAASAAEQEEKGADSALEGPPGPAAGISAGWQRAMAERSRWWSLQPVRDREVPAVRDGDWSDQPVDRFLLAAMERRELVPVADAGARVVARRLHFVLTGLPPSVEEGDRFEEAWGRNPAQAVAERVEKLLASPHFGERQARHWMDLVRFAETHGSEGDPEIPSAWRYRDYLIRAFNADVPQDALIREHLAGDLLPQPRINAEERLNESLLGTAHYRLVEHGFQPIDSLDEQVKTVDSQIDTVTKAFQGLTVSCARCHDHKFDAVSQQDYYALYGVLASARPGQVLVDTRESLTAGDGELAELRSRIRAILAEQWLEAAESVPARLAGQPARQEALARARARVEELAGGMRMVEQSARSRALRRRGRGVVAGADPDLPEPWARWDFAEGNGRNDLRGRLRGELAGGADIRNGRLHLDGRDAVMRTGPLPEGVTEKTLEAWVALSNLEQGGGGVLSLEKAGGAVFDSLVFAEKEPRRWMAGSEFGRRSRQVPEALEAAPAGDLVQLACVYEAGGTIRLYRNGEPCGEGYPSQGPVDFPAGDSRILIGQRHTGGQGAFLAAQVEDARVYNRALKAEEIAASWRAGAEGLPESEWLAVLGGEERAAYGALRARRAEAAQVLADLEGGSGTEAAWDRALAEAAGPLHAWARLSAGPGQKEDGIRQEADRLRAETAARAGEFDRFMEAAGGRWIMDAAGDRWTGHGPQIARARAGDAWMLASRGPRVVAGLPPGGWTSAALSTGHRGTLTSPRFQLGESVSVLAWGGGNAQVRVVVDQYSIGNNETYPVASLTRAEEPRWIRLDTAYRKGSWAWLEFSTDGDSMLRQGNTGTERSWFGTGGAVVHDGAVPPPLSVPEGPLPPDLFLTEPPPGGGSAERGPLPVSALRTAAAEALRDRLQADLRAWRQGELTDAGARFLDFFVRRGLLPQEAPEAAVLAERLRAAERRLPLPRRAPGVREGAGLEAPLFVRGNHLKPGAPVPRGYPAVLGGGRFTSPGSGRLELAECLTGPENPLTARVMVNRLWQQVYGRGLVATPDDFGHMGDAPTHPELLDWLAARFVQEGWSTKKMLARLLTARAFRLSCTPAETAALRDAANDLLSHARVRRLEGEAIRDSLIAVSGQWNPALHGPGQEAAEPPSGQTRRSVYLTIRRTALPAFTGIFDMPVPFATTGRRNVTTVPAQSLAMLNDPLVIHLAARTAERDLREFPQDPPEVRTDRLFRLLLGRPPQPAELRDSLAYLGVLPADTAGGSAGSASHASPSSSAAAPAAAPPPGAWADLVQSLFNSKEFIYLL